MKLEDKTAFEAAKCIWNRRAQHGVCQVFYRRFLLKSMTDPKSSLFAVKGDSWFSHIAVEVPGEACKNEWCEPVSDEAYEVL